MGTIPIALKCIPEEYHLSNLTQGRRPQCGAWGVRETPSRRKSHVRQSSEPTRRESHTLAIWETDPVGRRG